MYICENTSTTVKVGPITSKDGKAFGRKRLFQKEVFFCVNNGSLANLPSTKDIPCDLDGYYNVPLPPLTPGNLKIVVMLDGYPLQDFGFVVLSSSAYSQMFSNEIQKTNAVNIPIENGHVVTDPNLIVGVDFDKCLNQDAKLDMPNLNIGSVGKVDNPKVADTAPVLDAVKKASAESTRAISAVEGVVGSISDQLKTLDTQGLSRSISAIAKNLKAVKAEIEDRAISLEDIEGSVKSAVLPMAKAADVLFVNDALLRVSKAISELNLITKEDVDGCLSSARVKLASGTGDGEVVLDEGRVIAADVSMKSGYHLAREGLSSVTSKLRNDLKACIKEEVQRLMPAKPNKASRGHH